MLLELLVAFIQAYIFTLLTAIFIGCTRTRRTDLA
jgi:F0F1-type ATP synthase membrane subunit a